MKMKCIYGVCFITALAIFGCNGTDNEVALDFSPEVDSGFLSDDKSGVTDSTFEMPIQQKPGLTENEAKEKLRAYIRKNKGKYNDYGEIQGIDVIGGNYTNDGVIDYFYSVGFFPGGDYVHTTHFIYESDTEIIRELEIDKSNSLHYFSNIEPKELKEGMIVGEAFFFDGDGETGVSKTIDAEFFIQGDKITFDKKYIGKFKKAQEQIDREMNERMSY